MALCQSSISPEETQLSIRAAAWRPCARKALMRAARVIARELSHSRIPQATDALAPCESGAATGPSPGPYARGGPPCCCDHNSSAASSA
eukprot:7018550-Heterocapsa_arctica.AAC.1